MFIHCVPKLLSDRHVPVFFVVVCLFFYILLLSSIDGSVFCFVFPSYNGTTVQINNMFSMT